MILSLKNLTPAAAFALGSASATNAVPVPQAQAEREVQVDGGNVKFLRAAALQGQEVQRDATLYERDQNPGDVEPFLGRQLSACTFYDKEDGDRCSVYDTENCCKSKCRFLDKDSAGGFCGHAPTGEKCNDSVPCHDDDKCVLPNALSGDKVCIKDAGDDDSWEDGIQLTHYWDCSGQSCDAPTLQPWDDSKHRAAKGYQPQDPNDFGGSIYGEKLWVTAAVMNIDMGPNDSCCGDAEEGGCGKCVLINNPQSINPDWTAIVMKKNTCDSCAAGPQIDVNVPGFDVLQYSLANICGNPGTGLTKEKSVTLGQWYNNHANTKEAQGLCDRLPPDYQKGCHLFTEWGWTIGNPSNARYKVVECPQAFMDFIGGQFDEDGLTTPN